MFGLKEQDIVKFNKFSLKWQYWKLIWYGSIAKGNYKNSSDIDLTIIADLLTLKEFKKIEEEIDDLLLPYQLDLSFFKQISNPYLIDHIKRVGITFIKKDRISYSMLQFRNKLL